MFRAGRVHVAKRDRAFGLARNLGSETVAQFGVAFGEPLGAQFQLRFARERGHTPILNRAALLFEERRVAPEGLADFVILALDDPLQPFDLAVNRRVLDWLVLRSGADFRRDQVVNAEARHQIVFQADEEARRSRIALAARAPSELVVYSTALVPVGSDDVKTAENDYAFPLFFPGPAQTDVRASAGHVGRDGDRSDGACPGDDLGLSLVVLRVERSACDSGLAQLKGERLGFFNACGADQNGTPRCVRAADLGDERPVFRVFVSEDHVRQVFADARAVRRDGDYFDAVEIFQLFGRGSRRGGHAAELWVMLQEVLQSDRTQDAPARPDRQRFLGFERGLQAVRPAPVVHHSTGEFIHQLYAPIAHDVIDVPQQQRPRVQRLIDLDQQQVIFAGIQIAAPQRRFQAVNSAFGKRDVAVVLVGLPVFS